MKFGETAIFRHQMSPGGKAAGGRIIKKADNRFEKGVFVGKRYDDNEMLFATKAGVYGSRTVKALPASQKSDLSMLKDMLGVPWEMQNQVRPGRRPNATPPQALPVPKEGEKQEVRKPNSSTPPVPAGSTAGIGEQASSSNKRTADQSSSSTKKQHFEDKWQDIEARKELKRKADGDAAREDENEDTSNMVDGDLKRKADDQDVGDIGAITMPE